MKTHVKIFLLAALVFSLAACATAPKFDDVANRDWLLAQLRLEQETIVIDRSKPDADGFGGIFSLRFDEERISGVGAPNRYFAPYSLDGRQGITIGIIAGTMMASLSEPGNLEEYEYYAWLQNVERWNLVGGNLELYAKGGDGSQAVLVFAPAE